MYFLGYDAGSSSVKGALYDSHTGKVIARATSPAGEEMPMDAPRPGWAEQDPAMWWDHLVRVTHMLWKAHPEASRQVKGIGIAYQMHGLVLIDKLRQVLRPAIIWCDSRAVEIGERALRKIGSGKAMRHLLNSPANFTAAKLAWVKEHEPEIYRKAWKMLLPGDYLAMRMTGEAATTVTGLSEGILWDYQEDRTATMVLEALDLDASLLPPVVPVFGEQGRLTPLAAEDLGLAPGVPVTYRAGDQPNNAFSLNVLEPGEVAATAGTSGVVYGVTGQPAADALSRVNTFLHVNHRIPHPRYGVLLCINGTGILNAWMRNILFEGKVTYDEMNRLARQVPPGAEGVTVLPFGNGAERVLRNQDPGAFFGGIRFNRHGRPHLLRAVQEGIAFSFRYGLEIMEEMGIGTRVLRAGHANMFLSPLFREVLATATDVTIELYDTDGAQGAAQGAALGAGNCTSPENCFTKLERKAVIEPSQDHRQAYEEAYGRWLEKLERMLEEL